MNEKADLQTIGIGAGYQRRPNGCGARTLMATAAIRHVNSFTVAAPEWLHTDDSRAGRMRMTLFRNVAGAVEGGS